jgi:hypothetical protein
MQNAKCLMQNAKLVLDHRHFSFCIEHFALNIIYLICQHDHKLCISMPVRGSRIVAAVMARSISSMARRSYCLASRVKSAVEDLVVL